MQSWVGQFEHFAEIIPAKGAHILESSFASVLK